METINLSKKQFVIYMAGAFGVGLDFRNDSMYF